MSYGQYSQDGPAPRRNPLANKPKVKRQKQVFPGNEIPHLWAHKTQASARNAQGNFYFDGDTIYSYGSHFPIARHVTQGKKSAILLTTRTYSNTTAGHISAVRCSIPSGTTVFHVPNIREYSYDHVGNLEYYQKEAKNALAKAQKSRNYGANLISDALEARRIARAYAKWFKLPAPDFKWFPSNKTLDALQAKARERKARASVLDAAKDAREQARRAERDRIAALELPYKIATWRNGAYVNFGWDNNVPTMLRISGNEVETSKGARVPIAHAIAALKMVRKVVARGEEFVTNGHTIHVGHYKLDRIEVNGTIHAGCHVITLDEIEQIAPALEAMDVQP